MEEGFDWWKAKELSLERILNQGNGEIFLIKQYGGEELIYGLYFMFSCFMVGVLWFVFYDF